MQGINRGSIIQAVGLVGRRAGRWRKQLAQYLKYLKTVKIYSNYINIYNFFFPLRNVTLLYKARIFCYEYCSKNELLALTFSMLGLLRWRLAVQSKARPRRLRATAVGH